VASSSPRLVGLAWCLLGDGLGLLGDFDVYLLSSGAPPVVVGII
jgi:hypothetical protein